ncbi:MAG: superoxide dismutase family protein [Planctomycetales bacterium]|nr:superoxide dismutase family protein [Planctomycetales bacterium]
MKKLLGSTSLICALLALASTSPVRAESSAPTKAICVVVPTEGNKCHGTVNFDTADDGKVVVTAEITGLVPNQMHAIHVHEFGDISDLSGKSAGGHYNPEGKPHGLPPSDDRHAGDLGNLKADADGNAELELVVDNFSVAGKDAIIGRAIVVHALPDDGGQPTGNAGARIGFGVIGIAKPAE